MSLDGYAADWPTPSGVKTWQTTRTGGVSKGPYESLNLASHVGDPNSSVETNRERLRTSLALPADPLWLEQIHGSRVLRPDRAETGAADGAVTARTGEVLAVMTADCLPVLMATADGEIVGIVHAGWRGLADGVIAAGVAAFERDPSVILAWLGPAIGPAAFEVGDEVRAVFVGAEPDSASAFERNDRGRWQADLYALARRALARAGVDKVYGRATCTFSDALRFFSHRREAPCGRMASLIWRET